jgi:AcrR family transcriptional regulator
MARPKNFSREGVLEKALPVFWKHGFADASLQELEKATGVNKSGLYSEFSGKEELFLESLRFYLDRLAVARVSHGRAVRLGQHRAVFEARPAQY